MDEHNEDERGRVAELITDLLVAAGVAPRDDDGSRIWTELTPARQPDHAVLAKQLRRMAVAPNPLDPALCCGEARRALDRKLRLRWAARWRRSGRGEVPAIDRLAWSTLSEDEQNALRMMMEELAAYHAGFVRRRRPRKDVLDTLLLGLADVFIEQRGCDLGAEELPPAEEGRFITFCHRHLSVIAGKGHAFAVSEVTVEALSSRWRRLTRPKATQEDDTGPEDGEAQ